MTAKTKKVVVDGANIAYEEPSKKSNPKVSNILAVRKALEEQGYSPIIIIDASLIHKIDDPKQLEAFIDDQVIHQAPAGTDADYFVLETADKLGADVISNDQYEPYRERFPWIKERRIPVMIINGKVELYELKLDDNE